jgi:hypothetical protein
MTTLTTSPARESPSLTAHDLMSRPVQQFTKSWVVSRDGSRFRGRRFTISWPADRDGSRFRESIGLTVHRNVIRSSHKRSFLDLIPYRSDTGAREAVRSSWVLTWLDKIRALIAQMAIGWTAEFFRAGLGVGSPVGERGQGAGEKRSARWANPVLRVNPRTGSFWRPWWPNFGQKCQRWVTRVVRAPP